MKHLFILLAVLNILYFGAHLVSNDTPVAETDSQMPKGVVRLTLVSEKEYWESQADVKTVHLKTPETEAKVNRPNAGICYTIGPYKSESSAEKVRNLIQSEGMKTSTRLVTIKEPQSVWVYLPSLESRIAALEVTKQLDENGVKDYYVMPTPPKRNAISLGVYSGQEQAKRRIREISAIGLEPEQDIRYKETQRYWVDYRATGDELLAESAWNIPLDGESVQRKARRCN